MSRLSPAILLLALAGCGIGMPEAPPAPEPQAPEEGTRQRVVERCLLATGFEPIDNRYANSLLAAVEDHRLAAEPKEATTIPRPLLSVRSPAEEERLADALFERGFFPEAAFHYRNLLVHGGELDAPTRELAAIRLKRCVAKLPESYLEDGYERDSPPVPDGQRLFLRTGKTVVCVRPDRVGVADGSLPKYHAAQLAAAAGQLDVAIASYRGLLDEVQGGSFAEVDLHAKLAVLCNTRGDSRAESHYLEVLKRFHGLGLELRCGTWTEAKVVDEEALIPVAGPEDLATKAEPMFVDNLLALRTITRVDGNDEQKALPSGPSLTYLRALEERRGAFLDRLRAFLPDLPAGQVSTVRDLADCYILIGRYESAAALLEDACRHAPDANAAFKALACRVAVLHRASPPAKSAAQPLLDAFAKRHPDAARSPRFRYLSAQVAQRAGRSTAARDLFADLATEPEFEFAPEAALAVAVLERTLLRVRLPERLTQTGQLPLELTLRNVDRIEFRFRPVEEPLLLRPNSKPSVEEYLRSALLQAEKAAFPVKGSYKVEFPDGQLGAERKLQHLLRLPGPGVFVVEAAAGEAVCTFAAVYETCRATLATLPGSSLLFAEDDRGQPVGDLSVYSTGKLIGVTDADGVLVSKRLGRPPCKRCSGRPCDGCGTCVKYWLSRSKGKHRAPPREVVCVGPGHLFGASLVVAPSKAKTAASGGELLYVHTDRSVYRAGDLVRFRGILRHRRERLGRRPARRYDARGGERVRIELKDKTTVLYSREFTTNAFGSFHGEHRLPSSAARKEYRLAVSYGSAEQSVAFEVRDLVKPDYAISLTPTAKGLRIFAGYTWGSPVAKARLQAMVGETELELDLDAAGKAFVPAREGQVVVLALVRGEELLIQKDQLFQPPLAPVERQEEEAPEEPLAKTPVETQPESPTPTAGSGSVEPKAAPFAMTLEGGAVRAGQPIVLKLTCRAGQPWEAFVVLGDQDAYDCQLVRSSSSTATVEFPATLAYDPGVQATARFRVGDQTHVERLDVPVRAGLIQLELEPDREQYEPGQQGEIVVSARDTSGRPLRSEVSLAAVDEALFSLVEDKTPDMYRFFYPPRSGACAFLDLTELRCGSDEALHEAQLELPAWKPFNVDMRLYAVRNFDAGTSAVDAYGIGGGAAGAYGTRWGRGSLSNFGGSAATESAVTASIRWPKKHQEVDGRWDADGFSRHCGEAACSGPGLPEADPLVSALTLLGYMGNGHTHRFGAFKRSVSKGLRYLKAIQAADGSIGEQQGTRFGLLGHATATLALCEAYAMSRDFTLKRYAEKALRFLLAAQNQDSGWGFAPRDGAPNALATGWAVLALKAAKTANLDVPRGAFKGALRFFDSTTDLRGWTWFERRGRPTPDLFGNGASHDTLPEWTAVAVLSRIFCGQRRSSPAVKRGVALLMANLPRSGEGQRRQVNFNYWYFGMHALFQVGGPKWTRWNKAALRALLPTQREGACADGSWDPVGPWGPLLGRVGTTALAGLSLEVYYRYARSRGQGVVEPEPIVRLHFPDTVHWAPALVTGEDGRARTELRLPDTITSVRLTARGVTEETAVGQTVQWVEVRKDFFLKLRAPTFFVSGDRARVHADVYNYSGRALRTQLSLAGEGVELLQGTQREVEAPPDRPQRAFWDVLVTSKKQVTLTVQASAEGLSDAMKIDVPVKVLGRTQATFARRELGRQEELTVEVPKTAELETAALEVVLNPKESSLYSVLEALRYLVGYPYG